MGPNVTVMVCMCVYVYKYIYIYYMHIYIYILHAYVCIYTRTLCDPMGCSPPGSSVHGISQARILKQVAVAFSRGSS